MAPVPNKFDTLKISYEQANIIFHFFESKKLNEIKLDEIKDYNVDILTKMFTILLQKVKVGPMKNNLGITIDKNYKLSYFKPLIELLVKILFVVSEETKDTLFKNINLLLMSIITKLDKGHFLFHKLKPLIEKHKESLDFDSLIALSAQKGTIPTFMFWKNYTKIDLFSEDNKKILTGAITNSDDRTFKWYIEELQKNNHKQFFQKSSTVEKILEAILRCTIPSKFKLKRIKVLSEHCNLNPYFNVMIGNCVEYEVLQELFKHYYSVPLDYDHIRAIVSTYDDSQVGNNTNLTKIYNFLKTSEEKQMFKICKLFSNSHIMCLDTFGPVNESDYKINLLFANYKDIVFRYNQYLEEHLEAKGTLTSFFDKNCSCGNKCLVSFFKILLKYNFFSKISYNDLNPYDGINEILSPLLLLFTKFYVPMKNDTYLNLNNTSLNINRVLSFLRIIAKKKSKSKVINFQIKFLPVMNELLNFTPSNKPVMKLGSKNWQFKKSKFTHLPPRHLIPYEIKQYNNFMLREKADGILTNNMPLNIEPKFEDIVVRQVKAEYIEELELYLVFDIELPNTNIIERYEYLRANHLYTKNTSIQLIHNIDDLIGEIRKERDIFDKFLEQTKDMKIRWYPKSSFMVKNASNDFKFELISNIIENTNPRYNSIINDEGKFKCDGLILSPFNSNNLFRDIKIKPKDLMTIDLLYDGQNWLDKEKNKYNNIVINKNKYKNNKIYRCYPIDNKLEPREIRFDKKYPNNSDIINMIQMIQKYNWMEENKMDTPYYHLSKATPDFQHNNILIDLLKDQTSILQNEINKLSPDNGKTWLDLGCGKGKLISMIKKYNPKKYVGLDIDVKILLNNLHLIDEEDWIKFSPCNLRENWETNSLWFNITGMKFDYIVLNFSLMHLFDSELFWKQLVNITKPTTKILFNVVSEKLKENEFRMLDAYMKYEENKVIYYFPWCHTEEVDENFISKDEIDKKLQEYNLITDEITNPISNKLSMMYDWYRIVPKLT